MSLGRKGSSESWLKRRPPEKEPTIEWSLAIEAATGKDEASTTEKVVTDFGTAMVGNTLGADDGGIGGEAMIEQMPVRNQKESNDQELARERPALIKEHVGETSRSETLRMPSRLSRIGEGEAKTSRKGAEKAVSDVGSASIQHKSISEADPKMKSLLSKSSEREGEHYHCRMILPTARRREIGIRTIERRLRKGSTKERPPVNDGGIRKKKKGQEESHCG
ncbi:hypothetical protein SASPL_121078 [Salvia splendens]|uniref:Uncharacterized protein n=1 Tax=Salvia splendens TaxID=180675 RepID=A0A8X8ZVS2_SALSN|nr:hypothetical protein SASPL_121078 [Salvia splendens]